MERDKPEVNEEEIVQLTSNLIKFPTINPPGEVDEAIEFLHKYISALGIPVMRVEKDLKKPNLIVELGNGPKTLLFNSHIDVVTSGDEEWDFDPFGGLVRDGKILGRGSADTKGTIACMIGALLSLHRSKIKLNGKLILTIVSDEENLGDYGTRFLAESGLIKADYAIVGEPTNLTVEIAERGLIWFDIISHGQISHSGRPHLGVNAIENMIDLMKFLKKDYAEGLLKISHPLVSSPTLSITMIKGGQKINVIPDYCSVACDRRVVPGENIDLLIGEFNKILETFTQDKSRFELHIQKKVPPIEVSPEEKLVRIIKRNVDEVTGTNLDFRGKDAATDAYIINGEIKIPTVIFGPGDAKLAHKVNEMIEIRNLTSATKALALTAIEILS